MGAMGSSFFVMKETAADNRGPHLPKKNGRIWKERRRKWINEEGRGDRCGQSQKAELASEEAYLAGQGFRLQAITFTGSLGMSSHSLSATTLALRLRSQE